MRSVGHHDSAEGVPHVAGRQPELLKDAVELGLRSHHQQELQLPPGDHPWPKLVPLSKVPVLLQDADVPGLRGSNPGREWC